MIYGLSINQIVIYKVTRYILIANNLSFEAKYIKLLFSMLHQTQQRFCRHIF